MNRYMLGAAVGALLLSLTVIPSPATAGSSPTAQAPALEVHREYGQRPVKIPSGVDRLRLVFHGRQGDTVLLDPLRSNIDPCIQVSLRGPSGVVPKWRNNLWRLPDRGRYIAKYHRCSAEFQDSIQLVKVRLRPLPVNGGSVRLESRKGGAFVDAGVVAVPRRGRVQVRPTSTDESPWSALYLKGAPRLDIWRWHQEAERLPVAVYLEAGSPVANEQGEMMVQDRPLLPRAGQRVILLPDMPRVRVRATRARTVPGTLDGGAMRVSANRRYQEVGVRFRTDGDQWVTATVKGRLAARKLRSLALVGADGRTLVGLDQATMGVGADLWYLPTAGRYRLMARTDPTHPSGRIELSTVRELDAEMPTDGQPLAFTAQKPGEWVLATGQLADEPYQLAAEATGATQWRVFAKAQPFVLCRSSFCDQGTTGYLTPDSASTSVFSPLHKQGPWIFLVAFGAGQSGTVTLRLTPTM